MFDRPGLHEHTNHIDNMSNNNHERTSPLSVGGRASRVTMTPDLLPLAAVARDSSTTDRD